ncbi:MAG: AraC family transcriptional regulator [Oscillospiraceae bacterium]|nr:AraC family transcriptional regulator [Oscillospiraceae bacterium]
MIKDLIFQLERPSSPERQFLIGNLLERLVCALAEGSLHQNRLSGITYVRRAVACIERHYASSLKVQDIAKEAGVSRSYLQLVFQKEMGCGVSSYVNRLRISKAKFLLTNTMLPLADIACQVGFNSRQNFVLAFRRETGIPPSVFRKQNPAVAEIRTGSFKQFDP